MTAVTEKQIDRLKAECSENAALFRIAVNDCVMALMQHTVGLTVDAAIVRLDQLREALEAEQPHDRPRQTIRIRIRTRKP